MCAWACRGAGGARRADGEALGANGEAWWYGRGTVIGEGSADSVWYDWQFVGGIMWEQRSYRYTARREDSFVSVTITHE